MKMLIMGAPGAGKGTQAERIAEHYGIPAISTGSIFRDHISRRTDLGVRVQQIIASGNYVPDVVTSALVAKRLLLPDVKAGFLLDGYPRTTEQVVALDIMLDDLDEPLDCVLSLEVDVDDLVARLLKRAEIEGRVDDNEETIRRRMQVYTDETAELLDLYERRGMLVKVDGAGPVDEVSSRIFAALDAFVTAHPAAGKGN